MISPTPKVLTEADLAGLPRAVSSEEARQKIDKAWRVVSSLCDGTQRWTMSVPARLDSDPDLVIGDALRCARDLVSERDSLCTAFEQVRQDCHNLTEKVIPNIRSERDALAGRVAELEAALKPNLFWNDADPEHGETSIFEVIDSEWNGGCMKHGDEMVIQQAVRLPNIRVRLIPCPTDGDDYFDYEVIDAALSATTPESKP